MGLSKGFRVYPRVQGLGFRVYDLSKGLEFMINDLLFLRFSVYCFGIKV